MAGTLKIGEHKIGDDTRCYVIAEIGHNHQGSVEKARELFREAKLAGADAVKLQKRNNRGLYTRAAYDKPYDNENSFGATYGEHREYLEFGMAEYKDLQSYAVVLELPGRNVVRPAIDGDFVTARHQPGGKMLGERFKAAIAGRNSTGPKNCNTHH